MIVLSTWMLTEKQEAAFQIQTGLHRAQGRSGDIKKSQNCREVELEKNLKAFGYDGLLVLYNHLEA
jgi:hypothetical protein